MGYIHIYFLESPPISWKGVFHFNRTFYEINHPSLHGTPFIETSKSRQARHIRVESERRATVVRCNAASCALLALRMDADDAAAAWVERGPTWCHGIEGNIFSGFTLW